MRIEKIETKEAYDLSPHNHAFINPYNGCSMGCPFCYWLEREGWENRIQIKTNIAEILDKRLDDWENGKVIYLGSVCDPYNELEEEYGLSRECLKVIKRRQIPLVITTSGVREVILRDVDLLKEMQVIIVVELARLPMIKQMEQGGMHMGIEYANRLRAKGLNVYATLAPICPGIIELEPILNRLDASIPVYVDCLRCNPGSVVAERTKLWIRKEHPELIETYETMIESQDHSYFRNYLNQYKENSRVKTFPFELNFLRLTRCKIR